MMKNFLRWFWSPLLLLILTAAAVWAGGFVITQDVPVTSARWRSYASGNAAKRANTTARINDVDTATLARAQAHTSALQRQYGMGELRIPATNTDLTIYSVVNNATLSTGVARYFPDRKMGQGNNVYAAHNLIGADILLNRTADLRKGDEVTQTNFRHVYHYRVVYNRVIRETETTVLNQTSEDRITLIHCEGPLNTPFRRVVIGRLSKVTAYHAVKEPRRTWLRTGQRVTGVLANSRVNRPLAVAVLAVFVLLLGYAYRGFYNSRR